MLCFAAAPFNGIRRTVSSSHARRCGGFAMSTSTSSNASVDRHADWGACSQLYGAHFKDVDLSRKATKVTFDSDDE